MSEGLYAAIGRKQVELDLMHQQYNSLLAVLDQVCSGAIAPQRVSVDLKGRSWAVGAEGLEAVK